MNGRLNFYVAVVGFACVVLSACSVKVAELNDYKLQAVSKKHIAKQKSYKTLYVAAPSAAAGYDTQDLRYVKQPYLLESFAKNQWAAKPEDMLQPLLVHSLQNTGYFKAVVPSTFVGKTDLRLDSEILLLQQDFLKKPSQEVLSLRIALVNEKTQKIVASRVFNAKVSAPFDTPYGGVIAANQALDKIFSQMMPYIVQAARRA